MADGPTNTTGLIGAWSMDGASGGLEGGFESALDINAIVAQRHAEAVEEIVPPQRPPLLAKSADDEDWFSLPVAAAG